MYTIIQSKGNAIREKWCDIYSTLQRWMTWMRHWYCCMHGYRSEQSTNFGCVLTNIVQIPASTCFDGSYTTPIYHQIVAFSLYIVCTIQVPTRCLFTESVYLRLSGVRHCVEVKIRLEWAVRISMISTRRQLSSPRRLSMRLFIYTS